MVKNLTKHQTSHAYFILVFVCLLKALWHLQFVDVVHKEHSPLQRVKNTHETFSGGEVFI